MPFVHALRLGESEWKEKRASSVALPKTFQLNDRKNEEAQQVSNRFCQEALCVSRLIFVPLRNPLQNIAWVCGF